MQTETTSSPSFLDEKAVTAAFRRGPRAHIPAGAGQLAYYRFGAGPDLVLVHGWPLHAATFRRIVPALAKRFTVHLFDMPGTGHTEWPAGAPIGLAEDAEALRRAVDALGLERYALLAHDSGAAIARLLAAADARVCGLVLGNTEISGYRPWQVEAYVWTTRIPGLASLFVRSLGLRAIRHASFAFGGCFTDPEYGEGEFGELFVRPMLSSRRVAEGQLGLLRGLDFRIIDGLAATHAKIAAPVLFVWGADDPYFPLEKARRMVGELREAKIVEIPGAKLFAHEDHPEEFVARAEPFLARCFTISPKS